MSRIGRDYLKVGQIMEILRQKGVRLIAVNDGVDSLRGEDDFTPFRNIMNEWYAKDTSKKLKSTFKTKGMSGKHVTGAITYGYLWDEKRENWLVDEEAAAVVKRIFDLTMDGKGRIFARADKRNEPLFMTKDFYLPDGSKSEYTLITPAGKAHFLEIADKIRVWKPKDCEGGEEIIEQAVFAE